MRCKHRRRPKQPENAICVYVAYNSSRIPAGNVAPLQTPLTSITPCRVAPERSTKLTIAHNKCRNARGRCYGSKERSLDWWLRQKAFTAPPQAQGLVWKQSWPNCLPLFSVGRAQQCWLIVELLAQLLHVCVFRSCLRQFLIL